MACCQGVPIAPLPPRRKRVCRSSGESPIPSCKGRRKPYRNPAHHGASIACLTAQAGLPACVPEIAPFRGYLFRNSATGLPKQIEGPKPSQEPSRHTWSKSRSGLSKQIESPKSLQGRFSTLLERSATCPLGLMWSDNGSGGSWGPYGPPGIISFSPTSPYLQQSSRVVYN